MEPDRSGETAQLSWSQVRLAAGDVQMVLLSLVLEREFVSRREIPQLLLEQTLIRPLKSSGSNNVQDIADRLAAAGLFERIESDLVKFTALPKTRLVFELLSPVLIGSEPRTHERHRGARRIRTIEASGKPLSAGLLKLANAAGSMEPGEMREFRVVWTR